MSHQDCLIRFADADRVQTDEEAIALLPRCGAARQTYLAARKAGHTPAEALEETLELWRELHSGGRPLGYGKSR